MNIKQRYDIPLSIKEVSKTGEFCGHGSVFGVKDSHWDIVMPGAFSNSLSKLKDHGRLPAMLWQHQIHEPIGVYTKMDEDDTGLYVEGRLLIEDDPLAKRAHAHLLAGSISGLSIGYNLIEDEYSKEHNAWLIKELDLWEVSLVTFPSNDEARVQNVKTMLEHGELPRPAQLEQFLREAGLSRSQAKGFMAKGYGALREAGHSAETQGLEALKSLSQIIGG